MSYDLDQFVSDCRAILTRDGGPKGREEVRVKLEQLLANKASSKPIAASRCRAA